MPRLMGNVSTNIRCDDLNMTEGLHATKKSAADLTLDTYKGLPNENLQSTLSFANWS